MYISYLLPFAAFAFFVFTVIFYAKVQNKIRHTKISSYRLLPNCLLTRKPVVMIGGKESLFYKGKFYNFIPKALRDHGYEIIDFQPQNGATREKDLQNFIEILREEKLICHWLCLNEDIVSLNNLKRLYPKSFQSLTVLTDHKDSPFNFNLFFHNLLNPKNKLNAFLLGDPSSNQSLATLKYYLKIIKDLAEQDYKQHEDHNELSAEAFRT